MTEKSVTTRIDAQRCTGCGLCVAICPQQTLSMHAEKAVVSGTRSLRCGQCETICPADAIRVGGLDHFDTAFHTFRPQPGYVAPGNADVASLTSLMRSRRSCRNYRPAPVAQAVLEDLVRIATTAPSGSNAQLWRFTIVANRPSVEALGERIGVFFNRLNRMAANVWLRKLLKWVGKPELDDYYRDHYDSVISALHAWQQTGRDLLFHGAPALILVGSTPGGSCPTEDALLATGNLLLAAHCLGLGSCLIGYAVSAIAKEPQLKTFLGIPDQEAVHAVVALGYPAVNFLRPAGRKPVTPRTFSVGAV